MRTPLTFLTIVALSGCVSTKNMDIFVEDKVEAPKIVAMSGTRAPWVYEIEKRLREHGFEIKRMASQTVSVEEVSPTKTEAYNEASARFVLHIDGYAPNTSMTRCFGGGYRFEYVNAELIDVRNNQTVMHYSNSGYSENCPPLSGTIFGDISGAVSQVWE